jgi:hypothetical protein
LPLPLPGLRPGLDWFKIIACYGKAFRIALLLTVIGLAEIATCISAFSFFASPGSYRISFAFCLVFLLLNLFFFMKTAKTIAGPKIRKKSLYFSVILFCIFCQAYFYSGSFLLASHPQIVTQKDIDNLNINKFNKVITKSAFPVQKGIMRLLAKTHLSIGKDYLISEGQLHKLQKKLKPGDIIFTRKNDYLSNYFVPGFWKHSAIYFGSLKELDNYFFKESKMLLGTTVSAYLKKVLFQNPESIDKDWSAGAARIIESTEDGVILRRFDIGGKSDSLAVIRPRVSRKAKLKTLLNALHQLGKPYDYNFNLETDGGLTCAELICKSYRPLWGQDGLRYEPSLSAGRPVILPNDMVRQFDRLLGTLEQQNDFVVFLSGQEDLNRAIEKDLASFRHSWRHKALF